LTRSAESTLSDDENESTDDNDEDDELEKRYAFPDLDKRIRACVLEYNAVFPKLNFSSPKVYDFFKFFDILLFSNKDLGRIMASPSFLSSQMYLASRCLSLAQIL
jgi:hypothetical protein